MLNLKKIYDNVIKQIDESNLISEDNSLKTLKCENTYSKHRKIVYSKNGLKCAISDGHFVWLDENGNEIAAPLRIDGNFVCTEYNSLTSLEGAPEKVGKEFYCGHCKSLTSLEGAPRKVGGYFNCSYTKIGLRQKQAYLAWLKTNPKENYKEQK